MQSRWWVEWVERLPVAANRPVIGYIFAVAGCAGSVLTREMAADFLPFGGYPFVSFFPVIILTAFLFGSRPGLFAGALAWLCARYFFIEPYHSLGFERGVPGAFLFFATVVLFNIASIHLMQRANRLLLGQREMSARRTEMREAMFHELQHRVSNKLQIIASLLHLQKRAVIDPDAQRALEDAAQRVGMIGRISRALHDPDQGGLGIAPFLEQVGRDIIDAAGASNVRLIVETEPDIELASDAGVPIALIIAETISNALEHGFRSTGNGTIRIFVQRGANRTLAVTVSDDGQGVAADFDAARSTSLGLRIATTLARQLNGSYLLLPGDTGAVARLEVDALQDAKPPPRS